MRTDFYIRQNGERFVSGLGCLADDEQITQGERFETHLFFNGMPWGNDASTFRSRRQRYHSVTPKVHLEA